MYQAGRRIVSHHKRHVFLGWFTFIIILLAIGGYIFAKNFLKADTSISPAPPPKVTKITDGTGKKKTFDEKYFTIQLPDDWKFTGRTVTSLSNIYTWKTTVKNPGPGVRQLQIYYDTPSDLGVNHVLPVESNGNQVVPTSPVSDNCTAYISDKDKGRRNVPAKYHVNFLCNSADYLDDVVGTSSPDGINVVKVTGPKTGTHRVFFKYTDHSSNPQYIIFTDAVQSFRLK